MHEKLKSTWTPPPPPARYPDLIALNLIRESGSTWHLDFSREDDSTPCGRYFASDAQCCPDFDWPWVDGFDPGTADWVAIGFIVVEVPSDPASVQKAARSIISAFMRDEGATLH